MDEAQVVGTVVATTAVPSLAGQKLVWIDPVDGRGRLTGQRLVAIDVTQSGPGSRVFFVRAREAAQALPDPFCPVDAAVVGIIDESRHRPLGSSGSSGSSGSAGAAGSPKSPGDGR